MFTNLTQDHLDFHDTMEDYFLAKRRLFADHRPGVSVVNVGDVYGRRLAAELDGVRTFAVDADAEFSASELDCDRAGCSFTLRTPTLAPRRVRLPMPGRFNVANALGALLVVHELLGGERLEQLIAALEAGVQVPGRFEPVEEGQDFAVLVDYAHTPDSLENVLSSARELIAHSERGDGRVVCVFGAGGDRDRAKRPLMGEIAARLADVALVTSDNPRSEDPEQIIAEIMAGVARVHAGRLDADIDSDGDADADAHADADIDADADTDTDAHADADTDANAGVRSRAVRAIADRATAIDEAIAAARSGDVVVIAGKGHEQGQEFAAGRKVPFDDATVARKALRVRGARR